MVDHVAADREADEAVRPVGVTCARCGLDVSVGGVLYVGARWIRRKCRRCDSASCVERARSSPEKIARKYATNRAYETRHPERILLAGARKRAQKLGIPCTITEADIHIPEVCPILGVRLESRGPRSNAPSLDRIIPHLGYVPGNVAVLSLRANSIKNDASADLHRRIADWMDETVAVGDA